MASDWSQRLGRALYVRIPKLWFVGLLIVLSNQPENSFPIPEFPDYSTLSYIGSIAWKFFKVNVTKDKIFTTFTKIYWKSIWCIYYITDKTMTIIWNPSLRVLSFFKKNVKILTPNVWRSKYSRIDQIESVEDSLSKLWGHTVGFNIKTLLNPLKRQPQKNSQTNNTSAICRRIV